jgi:hypothetical protein
MNPVFERAKAAHALDRAATVIGYPISMTPDNPNIHGYLCPEDGSSTS